MATSEFSTGKTIIVLAIVIGCFAVLWPNVFYPMMQTAFIMTKPRLSEEQVCCDVIYESKIDLKFFAELCKSVIDRESATDAGIRKYRRGTYPPPGMLERCRKKILELCNIDISEALTKKKKGKIAIDVHQTTRNDTIQDQQPRQLNLTECLEKHFHVSGSLPRRTMKEKALPPRHIRQERPHHIGSSAPHPALMKKGSPFYPAGPPRVGPQQSQVPSHRPTLGDPGKTGQPKSGGAMSFVMPIYTIGIVVFFLYTITKVLFRRSESTAPKIMDFHMDPEYRKYVLSEEYENGVPLSYKDYLKKRETEDQNKKSKLLGSHGRKQVFTAIEGIIAEMDEFRDKLMAEQAQKNIGPEEDDVDTTIDDESMALSEADISGFEQAAVPTAESEIVNASVDTDIVVSKLLDLEERASKLSEPINQLAEQLKKITEDSKIAVVGMETQAEFQEKPTEPEANEVSNIVLETSLPSDGQLLVAESQLLTHASTDHIEGWSDYDEQPVVVTGKMTISLLGKEASVHSTESKTSRRPGAPYKLPGHEEEKSTEIDKSRQQIEELANALIEDILHNQIPKVFEKTAKSKGSTPDIESYVVLGESKKEASSVHRTNFRKHGSQESLNSQGSSFEYVSACQDEPLTPRADDRLRLSLSPGSDQGSCGNGGFEMIKSGNHFPPLSSSHQNDASPGKLESLSSPSSGVLSSPEYENSFEKVNGAGDIEHPNRSQDELNEEAIVDQIQQVCDLTSVSSSEENIENDIDSPLVGDAAKSCSLQTDARHEEATQPSEECPTEDTHILNETPIEVTKHEEDPETSISHVQSELPSDVVSSPLSQEDHLQPDDILTPATETTSVLQPSIINNSSASLAQDFGLDVSHTEVGENVIEVQRPDVDNAPLIDEHDTVPVQWHESALGEDGH